MFVNRTYELKILNRLYTSDKFELIVIYGRRRIGKSSLILRSIENIVDSLYFQANEISESLNIEQLKNEISRKMNNNDIHQLKDDWEIIFSYIMKNFSVIIIDEFPYLISSNSAIKSILQRIIDMNLSKTKCTLVLMGSSIKMMENEVLGVKSPLYGRRTAQLKLYQLNFIHLNSFLPKYSLEDLVRVYAVTGGVPFYLQQFNPDISFWENIQNEFLDPHSVLFAEGEFLLMQEFKQITTYNGILQLISSGVTEIANIRNKMKQSGDISSYLNNLSVIELIERRLPLNDDIIKSRKGRYYIKDNFLKFWFQYIFKNKQGIITGLPIIDIIKSDFSNYMGYIFEKFVKEIMIYAMVNNKTDFPVKFIKLDSWWHKDNEFDLIGYNNDKYLFIEIKWKRLNEIDVSNIANKLISKSNKTNFKGKFYYMIVARKIDGIDKIKIENLRLIDLSIIETWL